jgi:hypothetical protein
MEEKMNKVPFDPKEVDDAQEVPSFFPGMAPSKIYKTPISPKENYRALYKRELPLWIPTFSDSTMFQPRIDPDFMARCEIMEASTEHAS